MGFIIVPGDVHVRQFFYAQKTNNLSNNIITIRIRIQTFNIDVSTKDDLVFLDKLVIYLTCVEILNRLF